MGAAAFIDEQSRDVGERRDRGVAIAITRHETDGRRKAIVRTWHRALRIGRSKGATVQVGLGGSDF
jgi:hypothetical protein